ncbi:MAG: hypothetical protein KatS3mg060_1708 [Dehalococcoidia bacterium]|nr:MAG: hypothetical protein KatS3mg060_1708 [Dehalococcoidia bacterium]
MRLPEVFQSEHWEPSCLPPGGSMLQVCLLRKASGAATVLRDGSIRVNAVEHVGFVGANGSGKSTILHLIAGIDGADSGAITVAPGTKVG